MKKENILPVNAFYFTWLRDKGSMNRPKYQWVDKDTGEVLQERNYMNSLDLLIYIMLLTRADSEKLTCFPSIDTICKDCGFIDRRKAWKHIDALEQMGLIDVRKVRGKPNQYYMKDFAEWRKKPCY